MTQMIALISLAVFVVVMGGVGVASAKKVNSVDGFLLGGRNIGPWLTAFAYGTSYFSAVIFIGYAGMMGWRVGISSIWIGVGNAILGCFLAWKLLAVPTHKMTRKLNARTMPEFFQARYGDRNMKLYGALIIFLFLVPYAAGVYKGLGVLFNSIFPAASPNVCMLLVAILTAVYLVLGGYVATALNDFIQGIIMIVGIVAMVVILITRPEVGGFSGAFEKLSAIDPQLVDLTGGDNFSLLIINIALTSFGVWGLPQMVQKYYAVKDEKSIKLATTVSTFFALFIGLGAYFTGSLGHIFIKANAQGMPDLKQGFDGIVPGILMQALTQNVFSNIILSLIMLLLLSASMSTLAAIVLSSSSAVAIDFACELKKDMSQRKQMIILRVMCVLFIVASYLFATMNISFIVNIMSFSWGIVAGCFIGPYIWGLYGKKITSKGAWAGLLSGIIVVSGLIVFVSLNTGFEHAKTLAPLFGVISIITSIIIVPLVSLVTKVEK